MKFCRHAGLAAFCALLLGLGLVLYPMFRSGFVAIPGSAVDSRLGNYILEHGYRTLLVARDWQGFWNPPFFYPVSNVAAYTNLLLGAAPLYWIWRLVGLPPDGSLQLWLLSMMTLNFLVCFAWLRDCGGITALAASFGSFLFAFSSARVAQIVHPELQTQWLSLVAIYALCRAFSLTEASCSADPPLRANDASFARGWLAVFFTALAAQLYASFYLGWFLILGLLIFGSWALMLPGPRARLRGALEPHRFWIALLLLASALAIAPMVAHYLRAAHQVGLRSYAKEIAHYVPRPQSWLYMGDGSWLYGWMNGLSPWRTLPSPHEQAVGLGFLTSTLVLSGLWTRRQQPFVPPLVLAAATVILLVTSAGGDLAAWRFVAPWLPGAMAIRAISRVGLLLLVPGALGLAAFLTERRPWFAVTFGLLCVLEQVRDVPSYDKFAERRKVGAIVEQLAVKPCRYFYFSPILASLPEGNADRLRSVLDWFQQQHVDAMWASMQAGIPTINGFSGNSPPGWETLEFSAIGRRADDERLERALAGWVRTQGLDPAGLCWIKLPETTPGDGESPAR
jgi:hypothetical protein